MNDSAMQAGFHSCPLTRADIDVAYPLARELDPRMTLERWHDYARKRTTRDRRTYPMPGIAATMHRRVIRAIAAYDIDYLASEPRLLVRDVVVLGGPHDEALARQLLASLLDLADLYGCVSLRVELPRCSLRLARDWSDPRGRLYRKPVFCQPAAEPDADRDGTVIALPAG